MAGDRPSNLKDQSRWLTKAWLSGEATVKTANSLRNRVPIREAIRRSVQGGIMHDLQIVDLFLIRFSGDDMSRYLGSFTIASL